MDGFIARGGSYYAMAVLGFKRTLIVEERVHDRDTDKCKKKMEIEKGARRDDHASKRKEFFCCLSSGTTFLNLHPGSSGHECQNDVPNSDSNTNCCICIQFFVVKDTNTEKNSDILEKLLVFVHKLTSLRLAEPEWIFHLESNHSSPRS